MSRNSIDITLWGDHCQIEGAELASLRGLPMPPAVAIKGGCVTEFNGKTIGTISNTTVFINPDIEQTSILQNWFHENGFRSASPSLRRKFNASHSGSHKVTTIKDLQTLQSSKKSIWYSLEATITNVNIDDFYFLAYPLFVDGIQCMKKIAQKVGDIWHCAKCDGEFLECDYRYILKVDLEDVTGSIHGVIAFDDAANQRMGISAKDLCLLSTETTSLDEIVQRICNKKLLLTLSVRTETFCRVARLKIVIVMVENT